MALMINEECTACGTCMDECPNSAISEGEDRYSIDPAKCTECEGVEDGPQCASVCPTEACVKA